MPTFNVGTLDISSLLAARFQSVAKFGLVTIEQVLRADLQAHNIIMADLVADFVDVTTDRQRIYGTSANGDMIEVDEYGRAPTQKVLTGSTVGFPLRQFQYNLGWTRKWFQTHTPAEMAIQVIAAEKAHRRAIQREIKKAIMLSANYTFRDHLVDNVDLAVKRLVNADSAGIPDGPNAEAFDGTTHTHYAANASLTTGVLTALINNVVEHGFGGKVIVAFNKADEATVRALTGFVSYIDPRLIVPGGATTGVPGKRLDISRLDNRAIGVYGAAEIWIKPWIPQYYALATDIASPDKPLCMRERDKGGRGLSIAADFDQFPLHAKAMEAEFGMGVWNRTNGAMLFFNGGAYVDPVL